MKRMISVLSALAGVGCANTPEEIRAYCERYAAKNLTYGQHQNPAAYREDLMISCMAMKRTPYGPSAPPLVPTDADWTNPAIPQAELTKALGRDKASCIERAYVGHGSSGSNSGRFSGVGTPYGSVVDGSHSGSYGSAPVFDDRLFVACMNAAGWELKGAEDAATAAPASEEGGVAN